MVTLIFHFEKVLNFEFSHGIIWGSRLLLLPDLWLLSLCHTRNFHKEGPSPRVRTNWTKGLNKEPKNLHPTLTIRRGLTRMQTRTNTKTHLSSVYNSTKTFVNHQAHWLVHFPLQSSVEFVSTTRLQPQTFPSRQVVIAEWNTYS